MKVEGTGGESIKDKGQTSRTAVPLNPVLIPICWCYISPDQLVSAIIGYTLRGLP